MTAEGSTWHLLLRMSSRVLREIDHRLDEEHRMRVTEFDVLITLDNAPEKMLRMTDLARATMLSAGGLTRLVGRLESRGQVRREPDPQDARGYNALLTATGADALAQARVTHDAVIAEELRRLDRSQLSQLSRLLETALG
jgi:DNA-binding MarR family transcriptional regulator